MDVELDLEKCDHSFCYCGRKVPDDASLANVVYLCLDFDGMLAELEREKCLDVRHAIETAQRTIEIDHSNSIIGAMIFERYPVTRKNAVGMDVFLAWRYRLAAQLMRTIQGEQSGVVGRVYTPSEVPIAMICRR